MKNVKKIQKGTVSKRVFTGRIGRTILTCVGRRGSSGVERRVYIKRGIINSERSYCMLNEQNERQRIVSYIPDVPVSKKKDTVVTDRVTFVHTILLSKPGFRRDIGVGDGIMNRYWKVVPCLLNETGQGTVARVITRNETSHPIIVCVTFFVTELDPNVYLRMENTKLLVIIFLYVSPRNQAPVSTDSVPRLSGVRLVWSI